MPIHGFRNMGFVGSGFRPLEATSSATITTYTEDNVVYTVHSFTTPGTFDFNVTKVGSLRDVDYLIVAGGGGGGAADNEEEAGSGGGAGGLREGVIRLTSTGAIPIVVGSAGAGGSGGGGAGGGIALSGDAGTANTGGGGGGPGTNTTTSTATNFGGNGGSGVVILRYPVTFTITIGAGLTGTTSTVGDEKITTITAGTGDVSWAA
jgi:hypothetical protein